MSACETSTQTLGHALKISDLHAHIAAGPDFWSCHQPRPSVPLALKRKQNAIDIAGSTKSAPPSRNLANLYHGSIHKRQRRTSLPPQPYVPHDQNRGKRLKLASHHDPTPHPTAILSSRSIIPDEAQKDHDDNDSSSFGTQGLKPGTPSLPTDIQYMLTFRFKQELQKVNEKLERYLQSEPIVHQHRIIQYGAEVAEEFLAGLTPEYVRDEYWEEQHRLEMEGEARLMESSSEDEDEGEGGDESKIHSPTQQKDRSRDEGGAATKKETYGDRSGSGGSLLG